jgi:hypothetical protein
MRPAHFSSQLTNSIDQRFGMFRAGYVPITEWKLMSVVLPGERKTGNFLTA